MVAALPVKVSFYFASSLSGGNQRSPQHAPGQPASQRYNNKWHTGSHLQYPLQFADPQVRVVQTLPSSHRRNLLFKIKGSNFEFRMYCAYNAALAPVHQGSIQALQEDVPSSTITGTIITITTTQNYNDISENKNKNKN